MYYLFSIILLLLKVLEIDSIYCIAEQNYTTANNFDCHKYYICSSGVLQNLTCPEDTPYYDVGQVNCSSTYDCGQLKRTSCDLSLTIPLEIYNLDTCVTTPFFACNNRAQQFCSDSCIYKNFTADHGRLTFCVTTDKLPPVWTSCNCILTT